MLIQWTNALSYDTLFSWGLLSVVGDGVPRVGGGLRVVEGGVPPAAARLPVVRDIGRPHRAAAHADLARDLRDLLHLREQLVRDAGPGLARAPELRQLVEDLLHPLHVELGHVLVVTHGLGVVVTNDAFC